MTLDTPRDYEELEARFAAWAQPRRDIRAAFVVGSRARDDDHPADEWADLDIMMITSNPKRYLVRTDWLERFGNIWVTNRGSIISGDPERFALFEGGLAVDFVVMGRGRARQFALLLPVLRRFPGLMHLLPAKARQEIRLAAQLFGRGFRVVVDKDGFASKIRLLIAHASGPPPPSQAEFMEVISGFWFLADRTARKVRRGELAVAMSYHRALLERYLLPVIEWHAKAARGREYDTWHGARFLEEWADRQAVETLPKVFARYDEDDIWRALFATMDLFRWLAVETAERLGHPYPTASDEHVTAWVRHLAQARTDSEDSA